MKDIKFGYGVVLVMAAISLGSIACTNHTIPERGGMCEKCHTDYDLLIAVHTPDTAAPVGGCGGSAPHYEPYDRVYLDGDGYEAYKESGHYAIGCTGCHNGNGDTQDKQQAHSGDFIKHPSLFYEEKCGSCHEEITGNFTTSIHNGTGQKRKVAMRAGYEGAHEFDLLPQHQIDGYNAKCATCHGTCGNCHVVRPPIAGGGLTKGHNFIKEPDWYSVCVSCHVSRGGHAFLGVEAEPDVHREKLGMTCLSCHDGHEVHGDGEPVEQRYAYAGLPTCEECHYDSEDHEISTSQKYHRVHYDNLQCQICHSQEYNNCGACHIKEGHAEFEHYMDLKIALNTLPELKDGKFSLVRRTLAHPDNWVGYGDDLSYDNFDVLPTYNYTTPHNILKETPQTKEVGGKCYASCHIRNEGGVLVNAELYLWSDSLETWEHEATDPYTVDGELPGDWFK